MRGSVSGWVRGGDGCEPWFGDWRRSSSDLLIRVWAEPEVPRCGGEGVEWTLVVVCVLKETMLDITIGVGIRMQGIGSESEVSILRVHRGNKESQMVVIKCGSTVGVDDLAIVL